MHERPLPTHACLFPPFEIQAAGDSRDDYISSLTTSSSGVSMPCEAERLTMRCSSDAPVLRDVEYNKYNDNGYAANGCDATGCKDKGPDDNDSMSDDGDGGGRPVVLRQQDAFDPEDQGAGWRDLGM